jgi:23S rRNA (uracil1939-C5)-methyltransferase
MARRRVRDVSVVIDDIDSAGMGCATYEDRQIKVRNGLPGERVQARVLKRHRGEWFAQAWDIADEAKDRVSPPCDAYPRCGGCSLQHLSYAAQLAHKQRIMLSALADLGVSGQLVRAPVASTRLHYRRKARLGVRCLGEEVLAGFRERFSSRVARLSDCKTLAYPAAGLLPHLQATLQTLDAKAKIPQVEVVVGDRDVALVIRHLEPLSEHDGERLVAFAERNRVQVYLQPGGYDQITLLPSRVDARPLSYSLSEFGVALQFSVTDFIQANALLNEALVSAAVAAMAPLAGKLTLDLFCGIGNFSLPLARRGACVMGYETAPGAVAQARDNARRNGVAGQCEFRAVDLYDPRNGALGDAQLLLLDPPRSGAGPNLRNWLAAPSLRRAVYVSCNPVTFAEDAKVFVDQGFVLAEVGIYDMFPQTAHVETLGVFTRSGRG